jgi:hypothetical protein
MRTLLFVLLAACSPPWPENVEVDPPPGAEEAIELVAKEWSARLLAPGRMMDVPPIYWFEGSPLDYRDPDLAGTDGHFFYGIYGAEIHLVTAALPSGSALVHEMLHAGLDQLGDFDGEHRRAEWDQVHDVQLRLAGLGL